MSDFSIYIELYNDTHSTLKFKSKTETRGCWESMPPLTIAPFKHPAPNATLLRLIYILTLLA
jgi:hypothetical protein